MGYNKILSINESFQYSINLQFDINNIEKVREYIPTKDSCKVLENYVDSLLGNFSKATTLIGPYGKGKSHLLLILLTIFNDYIEDDEKILEELLKKIEKINKELYIKIKNIRNRKLKYMPVIINSNYNDMNQAFLLAVMDALERENIKDIIVDTYFSIALKVIEKWEQEEEDEVLVKFKKCLKETNTTLKELKNGLEIFDESAYKTFRNVYSCVMHGVEFNPLVNTDIIKYYRDINYKISKLGYNGMIIVFDEFSKFIEYNGNTMKDLKIIQDFAELASRSGKTEQIILSCITHKAIGEYIKNNNEEKANAYRTIEGRFKEIYLNRSMEQNYEIISQTIHKQDGFEAEFNKLYEKNIKFYNEIQEFSFAKVENVKGVLFEGCFPINPITVYGLVDLCEKIAQNERTLFTFLTDNDPYSLKTFVKNSGSGMFNLDRLYDYFNVSLKRENDEKIRQIWIKTENALKKVDENLDIKIIKTLAIIEMLDDNSELSATKKNIALALNENVNVIGKRLEALEENAVVRLKKLNLTYDFTSIYNKEVVKEIEKFKESKFANIEIRDTLEKVCDLGYLTPRRYNQEFKMTRYFKNIFLTIDEFNNIQDTKILFEENEADGLIIYLIGKAEKSQLKEKMKKLDDDRILVKLSKENIKADTYDLLKQFEAIQFIKKSLNQEAEYSSELQIIEQEIIENIQHDIEYVFDSKNTDGYCYMGEFYLQVDNLNSFVSEICEEVYYESAIINNEMINKGEITPPIYKARNIVINSIIDNNKKLIKSDTSAEATIYKAIVEKKNEKTINNIVQILKKFIVEAEVRQSFQKILNLLYNKPYGVRRGVMPVLIALAMQEYMDNIILYYQSQEIELDANNISKIIDMPEKYFIVVEKGTEEKSSFIDKLLTEFRIEKKEKQRENIKAIMNEIKKWAFSLPRITRDITDCNEIITSDAAIIFKNELLKNDLNYNEFLFVRTKEIFNVENYSDVSEQILKSKEMFDNYLKSYINDLIIKTKKLFEAEQKSSLNNLLKNWYKKINEKIRFKIMRVDIKNLFEYISNINTYNDTEIIQEMSYILLGLYIEDWEDNTKSIFIEKLQEILDEVDNISKKNDTTNKTIEIRDENEVIKKFIDGNEITQIGKTLQNNVEDVLEEYGNSVSENEKIKILLSVMKKYI